ncbi:MAG: hypothetical protein WAN46_08055 [Gammaproteobacteria bacterium]|jgi:hypothetical protein
MQNLNGVYIHPYNWCHGRIGRLFEGRFKTILIKRDSYLLELCRYVILNPVRSRRVKSPERYSWSSYRAMAGFADSLAFLTIDWVLVSLPSAALSHREGT